MNHTTEKYKIWDTMEKKWFRPTYPGFKKDAKGNQITIINREEILFSQSGEMYIRKNDGRGSGDQLTHLPEGIFIPCMYSFCKDKNHVKTYEGDIVTTKLGTGKVVHSEGSWYVVKHPDDLSNQWIPLPQYEFENLGSSLEFPTLKANDESSSDANR